MSLGPGGTHAGEDLLKETLTSATDDLFSRLRAVQELAKVGTPAAVQVMVDAMATERTNADGDVTNVRRLCSVFILLGMVEC